MNWGTNYNYLADMVLLESGGEELSTPTCVVLPDGTFFVAVTISETQNPRVECWHLARNEDWIWYQYNLGIIGTITFPLTYDDLTYNNYASIFAYAHEGMKIIFHIVAQAYSLGSGTYIIDCEPATPVIVETAEDPYQAFIGSHSIKLKNGMMLLGHEQSCQVWDGLTKLNSESWWWEEGNDTTVGMFWPHPSDPMKVAVTGPGNYLANEGGWVELTITSDGSIEWEHKTSSIPFTDLVRMMGSPYKNFTSIFDQSSVYENPPYGSYTVHSSVLADYATPNVHRGEDQVTSLVEYGGPIARLSNDKFVTFRKADYPGTFQAGEEFLPSDPQFYGVDPIAGTMERTQVMTWTEFQNTRVQYEDDVTIDADPVTGLIAVVTKWTGGGWQYAPIHYGVQASIFQGPALSVSLMPPPLRQRQRDDGLATDTPQQKGQGSSLQTSQRRGGRVYY